MRLLSLVARVLHGGAIRPLTLVARVPHGGFPDLRRFFSSVQSTFKLLFRLLAPLFLGVISSSSFFRSIKMYGSHTGVSVYACLIVFRLALVVMKRRFCGLALLDLDLLFLKMLSTSVD